MMLHRLKILHWFSVDVLGRKRKVPTVVPYALLDLA